MNRGEVYDARLDPVSGSEQAGTRPVVIVSRDAINRSSPFLVVVAFTTHRPERRIYPSQVVVRAPDGGLDADSVVLAEQIRAIDKARLVRSRGALSPAALAQIERALIITLDLPFAAPSQPR